MATLQQFKDVKSSLSPDQQSSIYEQFVNDQEGYNYWLGNLNNGTETRYELLLGVSESAENKTLFTDMTGIV